MDLKLKPYMRSWFLSDDSGRSHAYIYCYASGIGDCKSGRYYAVLMDSSDPISPEGHATAADAARAAREYLAARVVKA